MSKQDPRPTGPAPPLPGAMDERDNAGRMRQRAEATALAQKFGPSSRLEGLTLDETREILHELMVHHIQLEMQNEELRRVQAELDVAGERYFDLYDLAPLGYCTVDERGMIVEANLAAATLLGRVRSNLIGQPMSGSIFRGDEDIFYLLRRQLAKTGGTETRELRMVKSDAAPFWVDLAATLGRTAEGGSELRCMLTDISLRKATS